ncbi:hypothetical protein LSAT2_012855, partial [Lamellibrachia satsuma]
SQEDEISRNLLFQLITVVIGSHHEMKEFLTYPSQQPPTLFQHGLLRKNNKTDMSTALKGSVVESSLTTSDNISVVIDGGDLLNTVKWPTDATYPEIATNYGKYVCTQFTEEDGGVFNTFTRFLVEMTVAAVLPTLSYVEAVVLAKCPSTSPERAVASAIDRR